MKYELKNLEVRNLCETLYGGYLLGVQGTESLVPSYFGALEPPSPRNIHIPTESLVCTIHLKIMAVTTTESTNRSTLSNHNSTVEIDKKCEIGMVVVQVKQACPARSLVTAIILHHPRHPQ